MMNGDAEVLDPCPTGRPHEKQILQSACLVLNTLLREFPADMSALQGCGSTKPTKECRQQHTPLESWITKSKRIIRVRALSKNPRFADEKTEDQVWQLTNHGANPARQAGAALHLGQAASGLPACFAVCHSHCQAV